MKVFTTISAYRAWRESIGGAHDPVTVGFVPTMGALHAGHRDLLARSKRENAFTVLSIFVNPTQFNQAEDFEKYPKTTDADLALATEVGVDAVLLPNDPKELYADDYRYSVQESEASAILCGAHRPGHFSGVLTVVLKLFSIVSPMRAYFGEKDFQQLALIEGMVRAFFLPIEIRRVPTVRESSGLALSSRNRRLSAPGIENAASIYRVLTGGTSVVDARAELVALGFDVEYLEEHWGRRFVAAWLEGVRLIDNVPVAGSSS